MPVKYFLGWLKARRAVIFYTAAVFGLFFFIYSLFGYEWAVAGYAALLGIALGAVPAACDLTRFVCRAKLLEQTAGRFPVTDLPAPRYPLERDYQKVIAALEDERVRLEAANEFTRRDAEEYYTLWAHQIKTPLAASKLLLQSGRGVLSGQAVYDLERELFRMEQYVDMAIQYQRLSAIESDMLLKPFALLYLVNQAARNCAALFIHKGLALTAEGVTGSVITDEKWFGFVLEQVFTNAVKYSAKGAVRVYNRDADCLVIEDTGVGIPAEDLPRVFEWGFTGAVGRAERSSTGIGLYLCKRILTRLGFGISIESEPGKGTRVVLRLAQSELEQE